MGIRQSSPLFPGGDGGGGTGTLLSATRRIRRQERTASAASEFLRRSGFRKTQIKQFRELAGAIDQELGGPLDSLNNARPLTDDLSCVLTGLACVPFG
jgi:hypothetical protein